MSPLGEEQAPPTQNSEMDESDDDDAEDAEEEEDEPAAVEEPVAEHDEDFGGFEDFQTESVPKEDVREEDHDDPVSLPNVQLTPIDEDEDELYPKLSEALERIVSCYDDEIPPPVETLQTTIGARDYDTLRANITDVWTGLLGYHQQRGIRPHHQVTHAFNVIHGLVTEG